MVNNVMDKLDSVNFNTKYESNFVDIIYQFWYSLEEYMI